MTNKFSPLPPWRDSVDKPPGHGPYDTFPPGQPGNVATGLTEGYTDDKTIHFKSV